MTLIILKSTARYFVKCSSIGVCVTTVMRYGEENQRGEVFWKRLLSSHFIRSAYYQHDSSSLMLTLITRLRPCFQLSPLQSYSFSPFHRSSSGHWKIFSWLPCHLDKPPSYCVCGRTALSGITGCCRLILDIYWCIPELAISPRSPGKKIHTLAVLIAGRRYECIFYLNWQGLKNSA